MKFKILLTALCALALAGPASADPIDSATNLAKDGASFVKDGLTCFKDRGMDIKDRIVGLPDTYSAAVDGKNVLDAILDGGVFATLDVLKGVAHDALCLTTCIAVCEDCGTDE